MQQIRSRGFTLIELLVVIAIIGILSAVVLASLNTARTKGADAAIKSDLDTIRSQAAIYYDTNNGYSDGTAVSGNIGAPNNATCLLAHTLFKDPQVMQAIAGAGNAGANASGVLCQIAMGTAASPNATITAGSAATLWSVYMPLTNNASGMTGWCVDSSGQSKADTIPVASTVACP